VRIETRSAQLLSHTTLLLVLLWLAFVVRGFWYCALLPPWEGYDEPYHFAALQNVAAGRGFPQATTPVSLEVEHSLHLLPLPWELQFQDIPHPLSTYDDFWRLPVTERKRQVDAVRALPVEQGTQLADEPILNYESQQEPLYYWLLAFPLRWMTGIPLFSRIYLLRMLNVLLASVVVPVCWWMAKLVLRSDLQSMGASAVVVLMPELMINNARVGNQSLALLLYSLLLMASLQAARHSMHWIWWIAVGCALGAGLLTMASFMTAIPAVVLLAAVCVRSAGSSGIRSQRVFAIAARCGTALAIAAVIAGPWYAHVHSATGSWSGLGHDAALRHYSLLQKLLAIPRVNWKSGALSVLISHIWFGGWSFLRVHRGLYIAGILVIVLAIAGVVVRLTRRHDPGDEIRNVEILASFYACFLAGLAYHVLITFLHEGVSASTGWYLYALGAAEGILLVWGLQAFLPSRIVIAGLVISIAFLDLYGMHALLMPYYSGLSSHVGASVPPALLTTLTQLPAVFSRLPELRPAWLNAPVLATLWLGYWIATIGTVGAVVAGYSKPASAD
jgi:4-amino-4-deoxy-L-arabinose transferase-like glycosyltransferase